MPTLTVISGNTTRTVSVAAGALLGGAIAQSGLPLEQPCAGRGTCGKCRVLVEAGIAAPGEVERQHLTPEELALNNRLACCARVATDAVVVLAPLAVNSAKAFHASDAYKTQPNAPLGMAIDLGSTTVAAFLTLLDTGEVCAGAASLNQQGVYGADVISRLAAAQGCAQDQHRLRRLAVASINQAVQALELPRAALRRIQRVCVVGNPAMHHLLLGLPIESLATLPFEPHSREAISSAPHILEGIFPAEARISLPPLIGGFVGSDALACLACFDFDKAILPTLAIDLGTNGEVMLTDGQRIITTSTAAGPAFEGVNISCGSRAVEGAVTRVALSGRTFLLETIGGGEAIGLAGTGLLSAVRTLREAGAIEASGRLRHEHPLVQNRRVQLSDRIALTQWDVRDLQKAKGAIRAATDILLETLSLSTGDLDRVILTGSFGGQVDPHDALKLGMLPPVSPTIVESSANGAGLGAALFLSDAGFARAEALAHRAEHINLDASQDFMTRFSASLAFS
ncbi:MAG TPA: ASKHA domain-containing protein [Thermoflexales bacterium]|nr:ASKHA domain-containing protein [Thermoflexales bacterium]